MNGPRYGLWEVMGFEGSIRLGVKSGFGGGPNLWVMGLYVLPEVWFMRGFDGIFE
jgi:hypothetical protein